MRDELEHAQARIQEMEHAVRKAERNLDVSRVEQAEMNKSIAFHVGKIDSLVEVTRDNAREKGIHASRSCGHTS